MMQKSFFSSLSFNSIFICSWLLFLLSSYRVTMGHSTFFDWLIIATILMGIMISIGLLLGLNKLYKNFIKYLLLLLVLTYCLAWVQDLRIYAKTASNEGVFEMLIAIVALKIKIIKYLYVNDGVLPAVSKVYREFMVFIQMILYVWWKYKLKQ